MPDHWWALSSNESEPVKFACCWTECHRDFSSKQEFLHHFMFHINQQIQSGHYVCGVIGCSFTAAVPVQLKRHLFFHYYQAVLQNASIDYQRRTPEISDVCCKIAVNSAGLSANHVFYNGEELICHWQNCNLSFDDVFHYFDHVPMHVPLTKDVLQRKEFNCLWTGCSQTLGSAKTLRQHLTHHSGEKFSACPWCGQFFVSFAKFRDHLLRQKQNSEEASAEQHKCQFCQKLFASENLLRQHCRHHVFNYKCEYCEMTTETPVSLQRHVKNRHTMERSYHCSTCNKSFKTRQHLTKHLLTHEFVRSHSCPVCAKMFKHKESLLVHLRNKHSKEDPKVFACHLCSRRFQRGTQLSTHAVNVHKLERPSGHVRFGYRLCSDGYRRLQTERYEAVEVESSDEDTSNDADHDDETEDTDALHSALQCSSADESLARAPSCLSTELFAQAPPPMFVLPVVYQHQPVFSSSPITVLGEESAIFTTLQPLVAVGQSMDSANSSFTERRRRKQIF